MSTSSDIVKNISTAFIQLIKSQVFDDIKETADVKSKYTDKIIEHLKSKVSDYEQIITENITSIVEKIEKTKKTESKTKRKKRKPKDPLAPKKPLTSFILFGKDNRNKIKKDNPELKSTEIMTELGKRWRELSDKKKKKYITLASDDKERYNDEMKTYTPSQEYLSKVEEWESENSGSDSEGKKKRRSSKKKKDPNSPKKALSAYIFFGKEMRPQIKEDNPDMKPKDITTELGRLWSEYKEDNNIEKYVQMAEQDKIRYQNEMSEYKSDNEASDSDSDSEPKTIPVAKKSSKKKEKKDSKKKEKKEKKDSKKKEKKEKKDSKKKKKDSKKKKVSS